MTAPITSAPTPPQRPEAPRPMFNALAIASSGLSAQRFRMEVIAQNLANAETTRTPEGGPYHRKRGNLEAIKPQGASTATSAVAEAKDAAQTALATATATQSTSTS